MKKVILGLTVLIFALTLTSCLKSEDVEPFDYEKQWKADSVAIAKYIKDNNLENVQSTSSGLNYLVLNEGSGITASSNSTITVAYKGWLTNGFEFDANDELTYPLGHLIPGWVEGLSKIKEGGSVKLLIPSILGYGNRANGPIPANSVLIFDIELKKVE